MRAHYELAKVHLYLRDLAQADRHIKEIDRRLSRVSGSGQRSIRWTSDSLVLKSRVQRAHGDHEAAERFAREALRHVSGREHLRCRVEALVALGHALRLRGRKADLEGAAVQLETARELGGANPQIAGVCTLQLAAVHVARGFSDRAQGELRRWHIEYAPVVEHGFLKQLAAEVDARLWRSEETFALAGTSIPVNVRRLRQHLVDIVDKPGVSAKVKERLLEVDVKTIGRIKAAKSPRTRMSN